MIVGIIQCRLNSRRMPYKALSPLGDSTVLGQTIKRARRAKKLQQVIVTTPDQQIAMEAIKQQCGIHIHRGPRNCLTEYHTIARNTLADVIVRITADCPMVDPEQIDDSITVFQQAQADYVYITPDGLDVEVFGIDALRAAHKHARSEYERKHVTSWIREHDHKFKVLYAPVIKLKTKLSIDTREDYDRICMLWETLPENFRYRDILKIVD